MFNNACLICNVKGQVNSHLMNINSMRRELDKLTHKYFEDLKEDYNTQGRILSYINLYKFHPSGVCGSRCYLSQYNSFSRQEDLTFLELSKVLSMYKENPNIEVEDNFRGLLDSTRGNYGSLYNYINTFIRKVKSDI